MSFRAIIKDKEIYFGGMQTAIRWQAWKEDHEGTQITIDEVKTSRTLTQNSYYWVYLGVIEKETGDTANDLHEFFKRKLLPPVFKKIRGEEIKLPASTTDLDKIAFGEYLERICALTNIPLPNPEEAGYISSY
jgi:hypothetical protein